MLADLSGAVLGCRTTGVRPDVDRKALDANCLSSLVRALLIGRSLLPAPRIVAAVATEGIARACETIEEVQQHEQRDTAAESPVRCG